MPCCIISEDADWAGSVADARLVRLETTTAVVVYDHVGGLLLFLCLLHKQPAHCCPFVHLYSMKTTTGSPCRRGSS